MTRKAAYVEDCPDEDDVDTTSAIPQSQKKVNFAEKLPQNHDNDSAIDSGYQSWTGRKYENQTGKLEKESKASRRVEIKIENNGKPLGREKSLRENDANTKRTKGKVRIHPIHDRSRLAVSGSEVTGVTIKDTRVTRDNENLQEFHNPCYCPGCQQVRLSQAIAAQQPSYLPPPQLQSTFRRPSMIPESLSNPTSSHVGRPNRPRTTGKNDDFRTKEPDPRVRSMAYQTVSPSSFETDDHGNPSYARSASSSVNYHPKGNFYSHSPMYLNVAQPIDGLETPSYQLPSYPGPHNFDPPLSSTIFGLWWDYKPQNMSAWWVPDWGLRENNYMYPKTHIVYSPGWDMWHESTQQTSSYSPSQYSNENNYSMWQAAVPHTWLDTSVFMHNEYKTSQTMDYTNVNLSYPPLHPPIRPQTVASFLSAKDPTHQDFLSGAAKNEVPLSTKKEKNRQFKDSSGHPLREATLLNHHKRMNTVTPPQNNTRSSDNTRDYQPEKTGHKAGTYKPSPNHPSCHAPERRQSATADYERSSGRPHPLTKDALAKLNKEHGDDIDSKVQGICRANSSWSTTVDEGNFVAGNKGKRGQY